MNLLELIHPYKDQIYVYWHSLPFDYRYSIWAVGGIILFLLWFWFSYGFIRKRLGHWKFRGTWYNRHQSQELVNMLFEDQAKGNRVMQHDEIELLRLWKFGNDKIVVGLSRSRTGY